MKKLIVVLVSIYSVFTSNLIAQVPNYVPINGLIGWWAFTGNAIDSSGNGNHGTVNGATLTTDRFGNANSAYNLSTLTDSITINNVQPQLNNNNSQGEYYLTDIIEMIKREENIDIGILKIPEQNVYEIVGVNTIEQLKELEKLIIKNKIETKNI